MPIKEEQKYAMKLAGIFACFALLIIGSSIIYREQSLDFIIVLHALKISSLGAAIFGIIGFFAGKILEKSNPELAETRENTNKDLIIKNTIINDLEFNEEEESTNE